MICATVNTRIVSPCLNVKVSICNNVDKIAVKQCNPLLSVSVSNCDKIIPFIIFKNKNIIVKYNIVCSPDVDPNYFIVKEGLFVLADGNKFKVM